METKTAKLRETQIYTASDGTRFHFDRVLRHAITEDKEIILQFGDERSIHHYGYENRLIMFIDDRAISFSDSFAGPSFRGQLWEGEGVRRWRIGGVCVVDSYLENNGEYVSGRRRDRFSSIKPDLRDPARDIPRRTAAKFRDKDQQDRAIFYFKEIMGVFGGSFISAEYGRGQPNQYPVEFGEELQMRLERGDFIE